MSCGGILYGDTAAAVSFNGPPKNTAAVDKHCYSYVNDQLVINCPTAARQV